MVPTCPINHEGSEKIFHELAHDLTVNAGIMLSAISCIRVPAELRTELGQALEAMPRVVLCSLTAELYNARVVIHARQAAEYPPPAQPEPASPW